MWWNQQSYPIGMRFCENISHSPWVLARNFTREEQTLFQSKGSIGVRFFRERIDLATHMGMNNQKWLELERCFPDRV